MKARYIAVIGGLALLAGYGLALVPESETVLESGMPFASVDERDIRLLSYTSATATFSAQRSKADMPFIVQVTFADGRPEQRCALPEDFGGRLNAFGQLMVKQGIAMNQRDHEFPVLHGVLDIRTELSPEFGGPYLIFTNHDQRVAVAVADGAAGELTMSLGAFKQLEKGCP